MLPKVSIIIVVFNGEITIRSAIESVLAQTYTNRELIIIDGASTDHTLEIIKSYESDDLIWVSEPDKGIYDAMNKGIGMASGEWLYFLGADDTFYTSDALQKTFTPGEYEACDLLYGNVFSVSRNGLYDGRFDIDKILFRNISHQAVFYRKEVFERLGLYEIKYRAFADWDFNIRCFLNPDIRKRYTPIIIANFAEGGESTLNPDLPFLRDYLFARNLEMLNRIGAKKLYNIRRYDKWWRLIRSLQLNGKDVSLSLYAGAEPVPGIIKKMHDFQRKFPVNWLRNGFFSKTLMFMSYCANRMTLSFK